MPAGTGLLTGKPRSRVVIVGAGFAGVQAALELGSRSVQRWADVTVVDHRDYHLFTPLLYEAAVGIVDPRHLCVPLVPLLSRLGIRFHQGRLQDLDLDSRRLSLDSGELPFDFLLMATGSETSYPSDLGLARLTYPLKTIEDAERLHLQIKSCAEHALHRESEEERRRLLTVAVVGAGPTGVELSATLRWRLDGLCRKSAGGFRGLPRVVLVEARPRILAGLSEGVSRVAADQLMQSGVEIWTGSVVEGVSAGVLKAAGHDPLSSETIVWTTGVRASLPTCCLGLDGHPEINDTLELSGRSGVFLAGDLATAGGRGDLGPPSAPAAIQMGRLAGRNIARGTLGLPPVRFKYHHPGDVIALGQRDAVAFIGGRLITGPPAWLLRRSVYLYNLTGMGNRLGVARNWWLGRPG